MTVYANKTSFCYVETADRRKKRRKPKLDLPNTWRRYIALNVKADGDDGHYHLEAKFTKKFRGFPIVVGYLMVDADGRNFVESILINRRLRGFGIGKMLYLRALDDLKCVSTSEDSSVLARRAWASIMRERPFLINWQGGIVTFFKNHYWMRKFLANNQIVPRPAKACASRPRRATRQRPGSSGRPR